MAPRTSQNAVKAKFAECFFHVSWLSGSSRITELGFAEALHPRSAPKPEIIEA